MIDHPYEFLDLEDGARLAYCRKGTGLPVIFIPGLTFPSDVFLHQFSELADTYSVILVDPRSHGRSDMVSYGNDYAQHARDLKQLIDHLRLDAFVLVGWSFGSLTAWDYCRSFPDDRVKALISVDMPPEPLSVDQDKGAWVEGPIADMAAGYQLLQTEGGQQALMSHYVAEVMIQRDMAPDELQQIVDLSLQTPQAITSQLFAAGLFSTYKETVQTLDKQIPTAFFIAEHWADVARPYIQNLSPNGHMSIFGGHMMFYEYPARFNSEIRTFLQSL